MQDRSMRVLAQAVLGAGLLIWAALAGAEERSDAEVLHGMLDDFLWGASIGSPAAHDRFWAEDLIYTSSAGTRSNKAMIMSGMDAGQEPDPAAADPEVRYTAADVDLRLLGDTAIVAFRLVATPRNAQADVDEFFNTGTFLRREGRWQVIAWQATRIPDAD